MCGVPQGSVLGPVLFILYTVDLVSVIQSYSLSPHIHADDTRVYGSCRPAAVSVLSSAISECTADIGSWMWSNRIQLNYGARQFDASTNSPLQHC